MNDVAKRIVHDSQRPELPETFTATRGNSVRIDVPLLSITAYRDSLRDIMAECQRQLLDSEPQKLRGRHMGIVLAGYQLTWRKYVAKWKRLRPVGE